METVQQIIDKVNTMPPSLQEELLDFADFLISKYGIEKGETLDEPTKALLDKRLASFEQNRESAVPAKDVLERVKNKLK